MRNILIIFTIIVLLGTFFVWRGIYYPVNPGSEETINFLVKKGEDGKTIGINLKIQGLIRYNSLFRAYIIARGVAGQLKAGEYELSGAMNIPEIVNKFVAGDRIKKTITVIEGWTIKDIEEYLSLKIDPSLEGYLFPDTYEISSEEGVEEIIKKMRDNFERKITQELREEIARQAKTISEIVIMASILEKEVQTPEDKKIVSGILWKRLENNIPLQVDAAPDTYKYKGLPLGPICNPGLESIKAAIYPQKSEYWYYLSTPEGETIFSKTLQEHNIAKAKYLK